MNALSINIPANFVADCNNTLARYYAAQTDTERRAVLDRQTVEGLWWAIKFVSKLCTPCMKLLKNAGKAMLNGGIAWLHPYYRDDGQLAFHLFPAYEILPFWSDSEHTELEFAIRLYTVQGYNGTEPVLIEKVEVYDLEGLHRYTLDGGTLTPDVDENGQNTESYITYTHS